MSDVVHANLSAFTDANELGNSPSSSVDANKSPSIAFGTGNTSGHPHTKLQKTTAPFLQFFQRLHHLNTWMSPGCTHRGTFWGFLVYLGKVAASLLKDLLLLGQLQPLTLKTLRRQLPRVMIWPCLVIGLYLNECVGKHQRICRLMGQV